MNSKLVDHIKKSIKNEYKRHIVGFIREDEDKLVFYSYSPRLPKFVGIVHEYHKNSDGSWGIKLHTMKTYHLKL